MTQIQVMGFSIPPNFDVCKKNHIQDLSLVQVKLLER